MKVTKSLIAALSLVLAVSSFALGKDKKSQKRGILESMQSVPCGAKERGLTGLGSVFGSVGVEHVNAHEQLCAQYLLRTDEMDYHIRPVDLKHAVVLPVGREAEFRIKKDRLFLMVEDGDKKTRAYQVVSMQPTNSDSKVDSAAYHPAEKPAEFRPLNNNNGEGSKVTGQASNAPPPQ
ncbi:MAG TPA: hypothetical protein VIX14_13820 [Terriglobales bacterium]